MSASFAQPGSFSDKLNNVLKTAFTSSPADNADWRRNNLGEIINKHNIDSLIPKLDPTKAPDILQDIRDKSVESLQDPETWDRYFTSLKDSGQSYLVDLIRNTEDLTRLTGEDLVKANQDARQSAIAHNDAIRQSIKEQSLLTKASGLLVSSLTALGNMAVGLMIGKAIQIAYTAVDNYIHKIDHANEKMRQAASEYDSAKQSLQNINSELKSQEQRLDELLSKDKLTYLEKGELERLQEATKELRIQLDLEEKRAAAAAKNSAKAAIDSFKKQYGDSDVSKVKIDELVNQKQVPSPGGENDVAGNIASYVQLSEKSERAWENYHNVFNNGGDTDSFLDDAQAYGSMLESASKRLMDNASDLEEKRQQLEESYRKAMAKKESGAILIPFEKDTIETYDAVYEMIKTIYQYTDANSWNQIQFDSIFDTEGIELTKSQLIEMYEAGELTEETLRSFPNLFKAISEADFLSSEQVKISDQQLLNLKNDLESLSRYGNVDLTVRPIVDSSQIKGQFIWQGDEQTGGYVYVHYTPVLPSGEVMSDDALTNYIQESLNGAQNILDADTERIVIKVDTNLRIPEGDITDFLHTGEATADIDKLIGSAANWDQHVSRAQQSFQKKQGVFNGLIDKSNEVLKQISAEAESNKTQDLGETSKQNSSLSFSGFTPEQSKAIDDFQSKINTLKGALSTVRSGGDPGLTDLIQEFPELQGQSKNLEKAIQELIGNSLGILYDTLGEGLPDDVKKDLGSIADAAVNLTPSLSEAFSAVQKSYDIFYNFKEAMNSDGLTDSVLSSVGALSDPLNDMVAGLRAGVVSSNELYKALSEYYQTDLTNYVRALTAKNQYNEAFYIAMGMTSTETITAFKEHYKIDLENCSTYAQAKMKIEQETLGKIKDGWKKYYNIQTNTFTKEYRELERLALEESDEEAERKMYGIWDFVHTYKEAETEMENINISQIEDTFNQACGILDKIGGSALNTGEIEKQATIETIDWNQRKSDALKDQHDLLSRLAEDETASYDKRAEALTQLIEMDKERANTAKQAAETYRNAWKEAVKDLHDEDIARIMAGLSDQAVTDILEGLPEEEINQILELLHREDITKLMNENLNAEEYSSEVYGKDYLDNLKKSHRLLGSDRGQVKRDRRDRAGFSGTYPGTDSPPGRTHPGPAGASVP